MRTPKWKWKRKLPLNEDIFHSVTCNCNGNCTSRGICNEHNLFMYFWLHPLLLTHSFNTLSLVHSYVFMWYAYACIHSWNSENVVCVFVLCWCQCTCAPPTERGEIHRNFHFFQMPLLPHAVFSLFFVFLCFIRVLFNTIRYEGSSFREKKQLESQQGNKCENYLWSNFRLWQHQN